MRSRLWVIVGGLVLISLVMDQALPCVRGATRTSNQDEVSAAKGREAAGGFSELALFLFGGGLGLFIALLGWSDQIRGLNKETKEVESEFLSSHHMTKSEFLPVVKPTSPEDQLVALTQLYQSRKLQTEPDFQVVRLFNEWNKNAAALESIHAWKYYLTVALTFSFFLGGIICVLVPPWESVSLWCISVRCESVVLVILFCILIASLIIILIANAREITFRALLISISDRV
jgi:hypothetical protein